MGCEDVNWFGGVYWSAAVVTMMMMMMMKTQILIP
jgi:hypothetical protein